MFGRMKVLSQGYSSRRRNNKVLLENDNKSMLSIKGSGLSSYSPNASDLVEIPQPIKVKTHLRVANLVDVDTVTSLV